jgi:putative spermidine/putrescine transport system substrate-binding protein
MAASGKASCVGAAADTARSSSVVMTMPGGPLGETLTTKVLPDFTSSTGIKVTPATGVLDAQMTQLLAQKANPPFDLMMSVDSGYSVGVKNDLLEPIETSALSSALSSTKPYREGRAIKFLESTYGVSFNSKLLKEQNLPEPQTLEDLWKPEYKGHVGLYSPPANTAVNFLRILNAAEGGNPGNLDPAFAKLKELAPNVSVFADSVATMSQAAAQEKVWVWFDSSLITADLASKGFPVGQNYGSGQVYTTPQLLVIPRKAKNPAGACALMDYLMSKEAQTKIASIGMMPGRTDVDIPEQFKAFNPEGGVPATELGAAPNPAKVTQTWNQTVR